MHSKKLLLSVLLAGLLTISTLAVPAVSHGQTGDKGRISGITEFEFSEIDSFAASIILDRSIQKGIYYLYENQLPSGEFSTYVSYSPDMKEATNFSVVFDTAFIVHTLNLVKDKKNEEIVNKMINKSSGFLLDNKEAHGVWRHEGKAGAINGPPDTDDTSMVFAALVESNVNISDESLDYILNYRTPEGLFYTWINSEEWLDPSNPYYEYYKGNDLDANVNADVLYAYSLRNQSQNGIIVYLNNISENRSFLNGTIYYPSPYVYTYLVTKAYADGGIGGLEPSLDNIKDYLLDTQKNNGSWGNDLDTALATLSLINMDYEGKPLEKAIKHILNNQRRNGSWEIYSFYIAPSSPTVYYGSQELTTSFSIEALVKYKNKIEPESIFIEMEDVYGIDKGFEIG